MKTLGTIWVLLAVFVVTAFSQVTTGRLEGTVTDPQGAAVPGAPVKVVNKETGQTFETAADEKGLWAVPSVSTATYTVTVNHPGFKTTTVENVKVDAGVPATVNAKLEVGALAETVEVQGGAEVLQTSTATVTSTLVGRQLHELPFTSRNLTELIVTQPGSATPGVPRSTVGVRHAAERPERDPGRHQHPGQQQQERATVSSTRSSRARTPSRK